MNLADHITAQMRKAQLLGRVTGQDQITIIALENDEPVFTYNTTSIKRACGENSILMERNLETEILLNDEPITYRDLKRIAYYLES